MYSYKFIKKKLLCSIFHHFTANIIEEKFKYLVVELNKHSSLKFTIDQGHFFFLKELFEMLNLIIILSFLQQIHQKLLKVPFRGPCKKRIRC